MRGDGGSCVVSVNECSYAHHVTWSPNRLWRSTSIFNLCIYCMKWGFNLIAGCFRDSWAGFPGHVAAGWGGGTRPDNVVFSLKSQFKLYWKNFRLKRLRQGSKLYHCSCTAVLFVQCWYTSHNFCIVHKVDRSIVSNLESDILMYLAKGTTFLEGWWHFPSGI